MAEIKLTIDGQTITAEEGSTVLDAARNAGVYIPHLCDSPGIEPYGACRLCVVEIDGLRGLPTSCTTTVADGMVVRSDVDNVNQVRRMICEMLISDHPSECLSCTSNQHCSLQTVASYLGVTEKRLRTLHRETEVDESNPFYVRDMSRCILCGLCVRACDELRNISAIDIAGRGFESRIAAISDRGVRESPCVSCGECVDRCPTSALRAKSETLDPTSEVRTICPYCGCGCGLVLGIRGDKIVQVRGDERNPSSHGSLCVKGRFGLDYVNADDRLTQPLIRENGELRPATWDEALGLIASKFSEIKTAHGPDALAGLASAKCTNEENFVFQKFVRAAIGSNNVDHCARLCHASTVAGLARAFGSGAMTNSFAEFEYADCIFITGSNTTEAHPIIAMEIMKAAREHGAKIIVADPRRIDLVDFAAVHLRQRSGSDVALFSAMMNVILSEGLADEEFIASRTEGFDEFRESIKDCTPEWAEPITGVTADDIRAAAIAYGSAERASIVYSMGITQHTTGTDNVLTLANLAMMTGNIGRESTGVNPLRGQNNVQGACDMASLPNVLPGYQKVDDDELRGKFEAAWGVDLPNEVGLTVVEIMNAAETGQVKGLLIMGENPMLSDPNLTHVESALKSLDLLVVQDLFLTETAELADVVLPAASFAEKSGTFTNSERRVQLLRPAFDPPGEARQDWEIICDLSRRLGYDMSYASESEIMDEMASLAPIYGGMSFDRLGDDGLQWPCADKDHPGTVFLHEGQFKRGLGKFHVAPFREPAELPDDEYPLILTTGRYLYHFHTGTLTRRSPGLEEISPPAPVEIHPADAEKIGVLHGNMVEVSSRRGTVTARAVVTRRSRRGTIFMPFHYREAPANMLTNDALDPIAKIPELKVCAASIKAAAKA
jgi:formate dehydrogenase alpha subunit